MSEQQPETVDRSRRRAEPLIPRPHFLRQSDTDVCRHVYEMCLRDDAGPMDVAEYISRAPVLKRIFLAMSNSAIFGLRTPVTTVERAVLVLGTNRVRWIVDDLLTSIEIVDDAVAEHGPIDERAAADNNGTAVKEPPPRVPSPLWGEG